MPQPSQDKLLRQKPPKPKGPIQHVVIIVKENHAFDNYFGRFPGVEGDATLAAAANPPTSDPLHTHEAWLKRATNAVRQQYDGSVIPAYWTYAHQFALCDHYYTDVAGPSTPNHLMLIGASSITDTRATGGAWEIAPPVVIDREGRPVSKATLNRLCPDESPACQQNNGIQTRTFYQPAGRFWLFQGIEGLLVLALSGVLVTLTVWILRRLSG